MYKFTDTTEVSEVALLPSEALQINGQYIEDLIQGYRTLHVEGREALSAELDYFETGIRDGSKMRSKRYPARVITVSYQLIANSCEAFREAYNKLGQILNVENAQLIFNDEQDKFFVGTPENIGAVPAGRNAVNGEFEILCLDPFKYSTLEYEALVNIADKSALIDYNGTYKAFPILEADFFDNSENGETETTLTGNGDCGFIAFFDDKEHVVQLGDPSEVDGEQHEASQTLMNQTFLTDAAWGTTAKKLWAVNSGAVAMKPASENVTAGGTTGTLLSKQSTGEAPKINYKVTAKTSDRTSDKVKVTVTVSSALAKSTNYFGNGFSLKGSIYMGGSWHDIVLKKTTDYWKGTTAHTASTSFYVNASASTTSLTGIKFKVARTDSVGGGTGNLTETACSNLAILPYGTSEEGAYFLGASSYGTGSGWHGASITRQVGADSAGEVGAQSFHFYSQITVGTSEGATSQLGAFEVKLQDANGVNVAGIRIQKNKAGKSSDLLFYVNGQLVNTTVLDVPYTLRERNFYIRKVGSNVQFNFNSYMRHYTVAEITNLKATKVTYSLEQYGSNAAMTYNGVKTAKFTKLNCDTYKNIPNKFSANDVLEADCKEGKVYLNGIEAAELGALGNDWEEFYLTPGVNQIGVAYSDWVTDEYAPTIKVRYREVFL